MESNHQSGGLLRPAGFENRQESLTRRFLRAWLNRTKSTEGVYEICIVDGSGKLGKYMVQHALDRGYGLAGLCRKQSVGKLAEFEGRIAVVPGARDDREVISERSRAGGYSSC